MRRSASFQCGLTSEQHKLLEELGKKFEILHNHPNSSEPSSADIIGLFKRQNAVASTVICHNGTIYRMEKLKPFADISEFVSQISMKLKIFMPVIRII